MKIFIDVDNTVLEHTSSYNVRTEARVHKTMGQNPEYNENAIKNMYYSAIVADPSNFKKLFNRDNAYILTKSSNDTYEKYKQLKIADVLGITVEELTNLKDSNDNPKYMYVDFFEDKSEYIKRMFSVEDLTNCILIDDYSENLALWEQEGGIGIKFYNEYNSPINPMGGLVISNFKLFTYKPNDSTKNAIFVDSLIANELKSNNIGGINIIPIIDLIYSEIMATFNIEAKQFDTHKAKHAMFMSEYYQFLERFDFLKIENYVRGLIDDHLINIIENPFPYKKKLYKQELQLKNNLVIEYNANKEPRENVSDVYITMPTELIYNYKHDIVRRSLLDIMAILSSNHK